MNDRTTPAERTRREERDDRTPPAIPFLATPRGLVGKLTRDQRLQLLSDMGRYYDWIAAGRPVVDPFDSGAARGTDYTRPRTKRQKPSGGYDAGQCAEPDDHAAYQHIDDALSALQPFQRAMLRARYRDHLPAAVVAETMKLSRDQYSAAWQWVTRWLYWRLRGY